MGFFFGKAKFSDKPGYLRKSLLWPIVAHGIFDYIQMAFPSSWTWTMVPFVALLWICSIILVRKSLEKSPFRYVFRDDTINITGNGQ